MFNELITATQPHRSLQPEDPQTYVEGGGTTTNTTTLTTDTEPSNEDLEQWYNVWSMGGPVGALLDKRALMIFGVGTEWATDETEITAPHPRTNEPVPVNEYLEFIWPTRDRDEWFIRTAQTCYWAGFSVWEPIPTQTGNLVPNREAFHGFEYVHPPTIDAFWNDQGEIMEWVQTVDTARFTNRLKAELDKDDLVHVTLNPRGRHPMGLSIVGRAWDEITTFRQNKQSTAEALQRFAYLGGQVKVGKEDGPAIDDNELRRVRSRYRRAEGAKWLVTGRDIDMQPFDTGTIGDGVNNIRDRDIQDLATALDVPLEWTNYAGDGLGTGKPAESRMAAFERAARGEQRRMTTHALEFAQRLIAESPFPDDIHIDLSWGDVVSDQQAVADAYREFKSMYSKNEMRKKFGDSPVSEDSMIDGEEPVAEDDTAGDVGGPFGGLMSSGGGSDTGNRYLSDRGGLEPWERALEQVFERVVWHDDTERELFSFDPEDVPQFAIENIREAILGGVLFSDFETVPDAARSAVQTAMLDSLEEQHGWSVDSIASNLQEVAPGLDTEEAERIARTETAAITNKAREIGYEERGLEDAVFYWQGPSDQRTTEACEWLKEQTNPGHGGTPVGLGELEGLVDRANSRFVDHSGREFLPHISCRHTFVRATGAV